jgi:hypothetical protein
MNYPKIASVLVVVACLSFAGAALSQTTTFSYQGKLSDNGNPANGTYDMQFELFDAANAGAQIGATQKSASTAVANGTFIVQLDFGASSFPGADRYLEIAIRAAGDPNPYNVLAPRQKIASVPYAIQALNATTATNATQLGAVAANQYVQTNSSQFIRNQTTPQAADFNVSGNGTVGGNLSVSGTLSMNIVNAQTQYNLGGQRILSNGGTNNLFAGGNAGAANTTGCCSSFFGFNAGTSSNANDNSFFGNNAGAATTAGGRNSFFGSAAGLSNTTGAGNSYFGLSAGRTNSTSSNNSIFGDSAGFSNTGNANSFYGASSGFRNTIGNLNTFYGFNSGSKNDAGAANSFFGVNAGQTNVFGVNLTTIGAFSDVAAPTIINNATAIGANALVSQSDSLVLGSIGGVNGATNSTSVGIGTTAPQARLHVSGGDVYFEGRVGVGTSTPTAAKMVVRDTSIGTAIDGITTTNGSGVFGESTGASGFGVYGRNLTNGFAMYADGNAGQAIEKGGFVKAMAFVKPNFGSPPTIVRCYNGVTGQSSNGCGFLAAGDQKDDKIVVDFGFLVINRFVTMTPVTGFLVDTMKSYIHSIVGSQVVAVNYETCGSNCGDGQVPFMLVVY